MWHVPSHGASGAAVPTESNGCVRRVDLLRGEAFFDVAHDSRRSFRVFSGRTIGRAVGTQFDVRESGEGVVMLVAEGRVEVSAPQFKGNAAKVEVPAGQGIWLPSSSTAGSVRSLDDKDEAEALAWLQQSAVFAGVPLSEVIQHFNGYDRRKFGIDDQSTRDVRPGGTFSLRETEDFARALTALVSGWCEIARRPVRHFVFVVPPGHHPLRLVTTGRKPRYLPDSTSVAMAS